MQDRIQLLLDLVAHKHPSPPAALEFVEKLNELINLSFREYDLPEAQAVWKKLGPPADSMLNALVSFDAASELSARWDPARKVGKGVSRTELVRQLKELVHRERQPFDPEPMELSEFQAMKPAAQRRWLDEMGRFGDKKQVRAVLKKWRLPQTDDRAEALAHLRGALEAPPRREPEPAPATAPARGEHHAWQPVKGKPGRRKRRLANGKWHYENVPMQKAGERRAEYLLRLMRHHLGEM